VPVILNADADFTTTSPGQSKSAGVVKLTLATTTKPFFDADWFPNTKEDAYWSASPYPPDANKALYAEFGFGYISYGYSKAKHLYVRLVR
jgi:hypothetical protein